MEGEAPEAHKGAEAVAGDNLMGLRKPERCRGPGARWLWNWKTAAVDPQILLPQTHVSSQFQIHASFAHLVKCSATKYFLF